MISTENARPTPTVGLTWGDWKPGFIGGTYSIPLILNGHVLAKIWSPPRDGYADAGYHYEFPDGHKADYPTETEARATLEAAARDWLRLLVSEGENTVSVPKRKWERADAMFKFLNYKRAVQKFNEWRAAGMPEKDSTPSVNGLLTEAVAMLSKIKHTDFYDESDPLLDEIQELLTKIKEAGHG